MTRCPSLDDYDTNRQGAVLAERLARRVQPLYDRLGETAGVCGTIDKSIYTDASAARELAAVAQARYDAHLENALFAQREAAERSRQDRKDAAALRKERRRVELEAFQRRTELALEAEAKCQRWLAESAEWAIAEKAHLARMDEINRKRQVAMLRLRAQAIPQWGDGVYVHVIQSAPVRWNKWPTEGPHWIRASDVLLVGSKLASALVGNGVAEII